MGGQTAHLSCHLLRRQVKPRGCTRTAMQRSHGMANYHNGPGDQAMQQRLATPTEEAYSTVVCQMNTRLPSTHNDPCLQTAATLLVNPPCMHCMMITAHACIYTQVAIADTMLHVCQKHVALTSKTHLHAQLQKLHLVGSHCASGSWLTPPYDCLVAAPNSQPSPTAAVPATRPPAAAIAALTGLNRCYHSTIMVAA